MTLAAIDWIIIVLFLLISLGVGLYFKNRAGKSLTDFFLGGRNFPWYLAGISMVATTFAADTPLAVTELVAQHGISGNWLWWSFLFGGMLTTFFFARLWRKAEVLTEIEFIELRYSGPAAAILRAFKSVYLGLFMNVLIIGWVNLALNAILSEFFGIPEHQVLWYTGAAMLIAASYSSLSGLWGVAITDLIQFVMAMSGTIILAVIVINSDQVGGIAGMKAQLPEGSLDFFPEINSGSSGTLSTLSIGLGSFLAFIGIQWWASWYPGAEPGGGGYIAQRMMAAKNEKHALFATLFFQIAHYCIRPWPWILVGLATLILYPELGADEKKLGYVMAMKDFLPPGLKGLLLVAFLAAYMSTISTQLNWGAGYLVNDLYKRFIRPDASEKKLVHSSRLTTLLIMLVALAATKQMNSISGVWGFIIEAGAGLGLVLILRWYWWRINAWSEVVATVAPFLAYGFSKFYLSRYDAAWGKGISEDPRGFLFTVAFTTICWLLATFLTKPSHAETLGKFYEKVRPEGAWGKIREAVGIPRKKSALPILLLCWLSAITLTYSMLFFSGKLIFKEWVEAAGWGSLALVSGLLLNRLMKRK